MAYRIKFLIFILLIFSVNAFGKIIYNKQDIIITSIDLEIYKQLYENSYGFKLDNNNAIKDLVLINNLINHLEKNNKEFLNRIDSEISLQYGINAIKDINTREFLRFSKVRDEFIVNYFRNSLNIEEIEQEFNKLESLKLPISGNNCLIIEEFLDLKNNKLFIKNFLDNLRNNTRDFKIIINGSEKNICIDEINFRSIEQLIINYIRTQTDEEFKYFVYGKTRN